MSVRTGQNDSKKRKRASIQQVGWLHLEVATPTPAPFQAAAGYHALTWRSHGHSLAAYL